MGFKMINARAETVAEKPAFRSAFRRRRCLIPASGFYEWQTQPGGLKQPFWITAADGGLLTFAGLWEAWLAPGDFSAWLEVCDEADTEAASALLRSAHAEARSRGRCRRGSSADDAK
jgi:putative SOS response-associated peptidase YedK